MVEKQLTLIQSWRATYLFLKSLWKYSPKKFSGNGFGLGAYLEFTFRDFYFDCEWRRSYSSVFKRDWDLQALLFPEQLLLLVDELVERNAKKFQFDLAEVTRTLSLITNHSRNCEIEKELWRIAIVSATEEKSFDLYERYYFSDWYNK
jgi:hypothetical protein